MPAEAIATVAVYGLGSMGLGIAQSLFRAGMSVTGYDVDPQAVARFVASGGREAISPAEAAHRAEIVISVVVTAAQSEAVLFGPDGAASTMTQGGVMLSCATMSPADARRLAQRAFQAGLGYLDAPISGGAGRAASGELTVMASGSADAFARASSVLDAMATTVYQLGSEAGVGASFKIVNQLLAGVHIAAACEAIVFAARLGLDIAKVYEVISASAGNSWMFENRIPHVLAGDYTPRSAVDIFVKDLGILGDIGREHQFPLPVTATALQMFLMTAASGMGREDDASVARLLAGISGVDLPVMAHPAREPGA